MRAWLEEIEDPPDPDQLRLWAATRTMGRRRYIWRGVLWATLLTTVIMLVAKAIYFWMTGRVNLESVWFFAIGPYMGFWTFRERWTQNERRYQEATGDPLGGVR